MEDRVGSDEAQRRLRSLLVEQRRGEGGGRVERLARNEVHHEKPECPDQPRQTPTHRALDDDTLQRSLHDRTLHSYSEHVSPQYRVRRPQRNRPPAPARARPVWHIRSVAPHLGIHDRARHASRAPAGAARGVPRGDAARAGCARRTRRAPGRRQERSGRARGAAPRDSQDPRVRGLLRLHGGVAPRGRNGGDGQGLDLLARGPGGRPRLTHALVRSALGRDARARGSPAGAARSPASAPRGCPTPPSQATTRPPPSPPLQRAGGPKVTPAPPPPPRAKPKAEPPARPLAATDLPWILPPDAAPAEPPAPAVERPPPAPPKPAGEVPEIVFVEDDAALAELLAYGLSMRGYRFVAYRNGREALKELLALDVRGTHPLLLLDVDLPALDGYSILDALERARPGTYRVVFTTVHGTEEEQLRGLEAGALDYLVKPISLRVALEKIKRWVGGGRAGRFFSSSPSPKAPRSSARVFSFF